MDQWQTDDLMIIVVPQPDDFSWIDHTRNLQTFFVNFHNYQTQGLFLVVETEDQRQEPLFCTDSCMARQVFQQVGLDSECDHVTWCEIIYKHGSYIREF